MSMEPNYVALTETNANQDVLLPMEHTPAQNNKPALALPSTSRTLYIVLAAAVVVAVVFVAVMALDSDDDSSGGSGNDNNSSSSGSVDVASLSQPVPLDSYMAKTMDHDASPCTAPNRYTCGSWIDSQPGAMTNAFPVASLNQAFQQVAMNNEVARRNVFNEQAKHDARLKSLWASCTDTNWSRQLDKAISFLKEAVFPHYDAQSVTSAREFMSSLTAIGVETAYAFNFFVDRHPHEPTVDALVLQYAGKSTIMDFYIEEQSRNVQFIADALTKLGLDSSLAQRILDFESAMPWADSRPAVSEYEKLSLAELKSDSRTREYDWETLLTNLGVGTSSAGFSMWSADYRRMDLFMQLAKRTDVAVLRGWAKFSAYLQVTQLIPGAPQPPHWGDSKRMSKVQASREYQLLRARLDVRFGRQDLAAHVANKKALDEYIAKGGSLSRGWTVANIVQLMQNVRLYDMQHGLKSAAGWSVQREICSQVLEVGMQDVVARLFADVTWADGTMEALSDMTTRVRAAFRDTLETAAWLDEETRTVALQKSDMMTAKLGYPKPKNHGAVRPVDGDWVRSFFSMGKAWWAHESGRVGKPADRELWLASVSPLDVNAFYYPLENSINLCVGLVQHRFFNVKHPEAFNYGSYGSIVGHEIGHAFDNSGRHYGPIGREENWWTDEAAQEYERRAACFTEQYGEIEIPGTGGIARVDGEATLGENLADNTGTKASYNAFLQLKSEGKLSERSVLTHMTDEQVYWLGWGSNWCVAINPDELAQQFWGVHAPGFARLQGPARNTPAYTQAFSCPAGSLMSPHAEDRCELF